LRPGILGKDESTHNESFSDTAKTHGRAFYKSLEYPQYTKPEIWKVGKKPYRVPKVLLTGHHKNIEEFRKEESAKRTKKRRPDLLK
jgi:tRNA (guanine37-N1)-methyltransferase